MSDSYDKNNNDKSMPATVNNIEILNLIKQHTNYLSRIRYTNNCEITKTIQLPNCDGCNNNIAILVFENPATINVCEICLSVLCM